MFDFFRKSKKNKIQEEIKNKVLKAIEQDGLEHATQRFADVISFQGDYLRNNKERAYQFILEEIEAAINGMLEPKYEEIVLGRATIKDVFAISKVGKIAGCFVDSGKIIRGKDARLIRDGIEVYVGKVENLNRFKDTVTEVLSGYECGINLRYNDVKIKDIIEVYEMKELPRN